MRARRSRGGLVDGGVAGGPVVAEVVDADGEPPHPDLAALVVEHRAAVPGGQTEADGQPGEVVGPVGGLEAHQVAAQDPPGQGLPPRQLHEQLLGRERDVEEEPDPQVGPGPPQHGRYQLELVVVHPHHGPVGGGGGRGVGEALVDPLVAVVPAAVELGRLHLVVVERPQGAVGHPVVEQLLVLGGQAHRHQAHAVDRGRRQWGVDQITGPAHPHQAVGAGQGRGQGRHQPARAGGPSRLAVAVGLDPTERQPVGHHHELGGGVGGPDGGCGHRFRLGDRIRRRPPCRRHRGGRPGRSPPPGSWRPPPPGR